MSLITRWTPSQFLDREGRPYTDGRNDYANGQIQHLSDDYSPINRLQLTGITNIVVIFGEHILINGNEGIIYSDMINFSEELKELKIKNLLSNAFSLVSHSQWHGVAQTLDGDVFLLGCDYVEDEIEINLLNKIAENVESIFMLRYVSDGCFIGMLKNDLTTIEVYALVDRIVTDDDSQYIYLYGTVEVPEQVRWIDGSLLIGITGKMYDITIGAKVGLDELDIPNCRDATRRLERLIYIDENGRLVVEEELSHWWLNSHGRLICNYLKPMLTELIEDGCEEILDDYGDLIKRDGEIFYHTYVDRKYVKVEDGEMLRLILENPNPRHQMRFLKSKSARK